jgi:hypothetical protein
LPFFFWLLAALFDFGNMDQLFAFLAVAGIVFLYINYKKPMTSKVLKADLLCFFLMVSPLVWRMSVVPIELFNYMAFIIPTALFVLLYLLSLYFGCRQYAQLR